MSYRSRVYRQRNPKAHDDGKKEPFFLKQNDINKSGQRPAFFQAKLSVNKPGDSYEKEADSVANAVVNRQAGTIPIVQRKNVSSIQRLSTPAEDEKLSTNDARMKKDKEIQKKPDQGMSPDLEKEKLKSIQKKDDPEKEKLKGIQKMDDPEKKKKEGIQKMDDPMKEEKDKKKTSAVQTKQDAAVNTASPQVSSRIESSSGKGQALPPKTLNEMSSTFGVDFSGVHIHNDSEASGMNKELDAQAFTHGRDIYFNEGKFNPENTEGKFLLAHELTHVVQQSDRPMKKIQKQPDVEELSANSLPAEEGEIIGGWVVFATMAKKGGSRPWFLNNPGSLTVGTTFINNGGLYGDYKRTNGSLRIFPTWQMGYQAIFTYLKGWTGATLHSIAYLPYGEKGREEAYLKIFMDSTKKPGDTKISDLTDGELKSMVDGIVTQEGGNTKGQELPRSTPANPPELPQRVFGI